MSLLCIVFLGFCICLAIKAESFESVSWQLDSSQDVTTYQTMATAASAISCVTECTQHSQCDSCAYERESGTCYLQVQTASDSAGGSLQVYTDTSPCKVSEAPINSATTNVTWRRTGRDLEGDMICNDDFMYVGDRPTFRCSSDGLWSPAPAGQCRQRVWRNPQVSTKHQFPRAISPGWAMCVRGASCIACARFSFNLQSNDGTYLVHLDVRFSYETNTSKIVVTGNANGAWLSEMVVDEFPFVHGEPFEVELLIPDWNTMQMYVNDTLTLNFSAPYSLASASFFAVGGGDGIGFVDVWAGCHR